MDERRAIRDLDRERMGLQTQEKKLVAEIKKAFGVLDAEWKARFHYSPAKARAYAEAEKERAEIAVIDTDETAADVASVSATPGAVAAPAPAAMPASAAHAPVLAAPSGDPDARMTPAVRRLLREHGIV